MNFIVTHALTAPTPSGTADRQATKGAREGRGIARLLDAIAGRIAGARGSTFDRKRPGNDVATNAREVALESALCSALEREEFAVHFQPQACLDSGRIVAVEALLRWNSPKFGRVAPDTFIPVAERSGAIVRLGEWVLREACAQHKRWCSKGIMPPRVAVNVSPIQLRAADFPFRVAAILRESRMPAGWLELELTESQLSHDDQPVLRALETIRSLGVSIALDDFGTGFSSLMHLTRMNLDTLKIARDFVQDLAGNPANATIVAGLLSIARGLGLRAVAEGVERESELAFLREHGCHHVQGYLTGKPEPADEITHLLKAGGAVCRGRWAPT
ncbi:EAL domain-containing protein [Aromatoleum toluvorans]|uniref:EAL domain-containing protein n=1 Tax=Aromatoleum toluvorans TaxID=92002 RepID=A0ABX1Q3T3_9RHOO|nr:EAL domain-containing protein [Aromatoleum toluvorans]NMG45555.1 EAL domain-containing protein [Aromatoleum toluvorans]